MAQSMLKKKGGKSNRLATFARKLPCTEAQLVSNLIMNNELKELKNSIPWDSIIYGLDRKVMSIMSSPFS